MMRRSIGQRGRFRVLIATDGSASARAALEMTCGFPWPKGARVRGVVAAPPEWSGGRPQYMRVALTRTFERVAAAARRRLRQRWPDADVMIVDRPPIDAILDAAKSSSASIIVLGWRGHGTFRRLLTGSTSRGVVERADVPVLVVRRRMRQFRRAVIGVDGSPHARRAVDFAARLGGDGRRSITVVRVVEPVALPTGGLLPKSVRAVLVHNAAMLNNQLIRRARREVDAAGARLKRAGWATRTDVRSGAPLVTLLGVVTRDECDLLIIGARGAGGLRRAILGSVAAGALNRSPVPVLVAR
jgi:nucleotide-binding universal stress UspA family protein